MTPRWAFAWFCAFSVLWSWPLVLSPGSVTMGLHFDQFPAAWLVHAAPSFVPDGVSELSAWPAGEPLVRLDSFLFLLVALVLHGALPGLLVTNLFVLLGPPVSAWAAERFAREIGATFPASLLAGLAFGFAPLATVGVLEGHVYYLLDPWLPLCALHAWRGNAGRTVLYWTLCLLTTAYMGVNGLLVVGAILLWRRRPDPRILGGIGLVGATYAGLFVTGTARTGATAGGYADEALLRVGSATLTTLVAWDPWMDLNRHSLAPALGLVPLCFALLAPFALQASGFRLQASGSALEASGFRLQASGSGPNLGAGRRLSRIFVLGRGLRPRNAPEAPPSGDADRERPGSSPASGEVATKEPEGVPQGDARQKGARPVACSLKPEASASWPLWLALGLGCAVLSVGPALEIGVSRAESIPTLLWPLLRLGVFGVYRFPIRFAWVSALALGAVAALVASRGRRPWIAVALAGIDAFVFSGAFLRIRPHPTPVPAVYALLPEAPVLDLYPEIGGMQEDMSFYQQNLSCYYQLFHARPILDRCLNTDIRTSPRVIATREVDRRVFGGEPVAPWLRDQRIGSVVLHADLYQPSERAELTTRLTEELGAPIGEGHDGGEWLVAFRVPG